MVQQGLMCALAWWLGNAIDRTLAWQTFQRPIVIATITGLFLGDIQTGIVMGATLESIFMGISAIGGSVPADAMAASIIAVAYTIISGSDVETGLALAMPIGTVMSSVNEMYKPVLASFAPHFEKLAASGDMKKFRAQTIFFGVFVDRLPQCIILFLAIAFGVNGLEAFMASLPAWVMRGLSAASGLMTGIGFAILTTMIWSKEIGGFFFVGFVLAKYLGLGTLPIAIIMAVVAIMYFFNDKKILDAKNAGGKTTADNTPANSEEDFF